MAFLDEMSYKIAVVPSGVDKTVWLSQNENGRELYFEITDTEIPAAIIGDPAASSADGAAIDITGLLTLYNGAAQFTLIDLDGVALAAN